jgi:hypothetical protein
MAYLITAEYIQEQMATLGLKQSFAPSAYALETLITEASDWVENYCDRKFASASAYTESFGSGGNRLILDDFPVTVVNSIAWVNDLGTSGTVDPSLVRIRAGGIIEFKNPINGPWYRDKFYTVGYVTGYDPVPSNVQRATALKVANLVQPQYQGPQDREIFMISNIDQMIVDLLEPYRRERIG